MGFTPRLLSVVGVSVALSFWPTRGSPTLPLACTANTVATSVPFTVVLMR